MILSIRSAAVALIASVGVSFAVASAAVAQVTSTDNSRNNNAPQSVIGNPNDTNGVSTGKCTTNSRNVGSSGKTGSFSNDPSAQSSADKNDLSQAGTQSGAFGGFCESPITTTSSATSNPQQFLESNPKLTAELKAALANHNANEVANSLANHLGVTTETAQKLINTVSQNTKVDSNNANNAAAANQITAGNSADQYLSTSTTEVDNVVKTQPHGTANGSVNGASCESVYAVYVRLTLADGSTKIAKVEAVQKVSVAALQRGFNASAALGRNLGFAVAIIDVQIISTDGTCLNAEQVTENFKEARSGARTLLGGFAGATATAEAKVKVDVNIKIDGSGNVTGYR